MSSLWTAATGEGLSAIRQSLALRGPRSGSLRDREKRGQTKKFKPNFRDGKLVWKTVLNPYYPEF